MKKTGVIGLGDMGSGLANNLLKAGYETWGFDLSSERNKVFADMWVENCFKSRCI